MLHTLQAMIFVFRLYLRVSRTVEAQAAGLTCIISDTITKRGLHYATSDTITIISFCKGMGRNNIKQNIQRVNTKCILNIPNLILIAVGN